MHERALKLEHVRPVLVSGVPHDVRDAVDGHALGVVDHPNALGLLRPAVLVASEAEADAVPAKIPQSAERVGVCLGADVAAFEEGVVGFEGEAGRDERRHSEQVLSKGRPRSPDIRRDLPQPLVVHEHDSVHKEDPILLARRDHLIHLLEGQGHRLLDEHVLLGPRRLGHPLHVELGGQRHVHGVHFRVLQQFVVAAVGPDALRAELSSPRLRLLELATGHGHELGRGAQEHRAGVLPGDVGAAHDPPAQLGLLRRPSHA
mmetsp:Transcript_2917/g.11821  ORF Transcript_2917/g.11821 Transcript_2917/m.11821 type:complete len:260 (-) Transcript_2917:257-1036(-)